MEVDAERRRRHPDPPGSLLGRAGGEHRFEHHPFARREPVQRREAARPGRGLAHEVAQDLGREEHVATIRPLDDVEDLVHPGALGDDPVRAGRDRLLEDVRLGVAGEQHEPGPRPVAPHDPEHVRARPSGSE